jgi:2-polyprenyl-3-methyl-5-hydroxy-6-metoxy-1,4-benzoquinol methylase
MSRTDVPSAPEMPDPKALSQTLATIYARAESKTGPLAWKQRLTSVWRPLYAPFEVLLSWVPEGAEILDIGCGSGAFLFLANAVRHASPTYGIDVNAASIALANAANIDPALHFEARLEAEPARLASAGVVTLLDVLHHVPAAVRPRLLADIMTPIRPGARLIIKDLDPKPLWRALANRLTDYASTRSRVSYISQREVEDAFTRAGFRILYSARLHKHVWSHYAVVGEKL